jgi:predicted amidohydrolase YtcJ
MPSQKHLLRLLGVYDKVGSIETGKMANFVIASDNLFSDRAVILQNWVQGDKFNVKEESWNDVKGTLQPHPFFSSRQQQLHT